jgi:hypothetical protein
LRTLFIWGKEEEGEDGPSMLAWIYTVMGQIHWMLLAR